MEHRTTHVPPEDPNEVRRRDLPRQARRDTSNARRRAGIFANAADLGASTLRRTARAEAHAAAYQGSAEVREVLANAKRYAHRFTPLAWAVLVLAYMEGRSDHRIGRLLGEDPSNVRRAREAAERVAWELVRVWAPTVRKWSRIRAGNPYGEELTRDERAVLDRHRKAKTGYKPVSGWAAGK